MLKLLKERLDNSKEINESKTKENNELIDEINKFKEAKVKKSNIVDYLIKSYEASSTRPEILKDVRKRDDKARTFAPPDNSDEPERLKKLTEASLTPLRENKYIDENTLFSDKQLLKKINPKYMAKIIDNEEKYKRNKKFYEDESEREHTKIKIFDKKIRDNPTISTKEINIITQLKELYELRGQYFTNKFNNEPEKNKFIDIRSIDNNIYQLEDKLRDQKGSGTFTYQNNFAKLLNLLAQLKLVLNNLKMIQVNY